MRLWHYKLISFLPNSQLIAQKRECDLIWKDIREDKRTNHILINYIWQYEDFKERLMNYYWLLEKEFEKRNFTFKWNAPCFLEWEEYEIPFKEHNNRYLVQNYWNLAEKFDRGQRDFSKEKYDALTLYVKGGIINEI